MVFKSKTNIKYKFCFSSVFFSDKCGNYGGVCANQQTHTCVNGQYRLVGTSNEVLCNNWLSNNERCCMAKNSPARATTTAPVATPKRGKSNQTVRSILKLALKFKLARIASVSITTLLSRNDYSNRNLAVICVLCCLEAR